MEKSLGKMDYNREFRYYQILDEVLCGGEHPSSAATPSGRSTA